MIDRDSAAEYLMSLGAFVVLSCVAVATCEVHAQGAEDPVRPVRTSPPALPTRGPNGLSAGSNPGSPSVGQQIITEEVHIRVVRDAAESIIQAVCPPDGAAEGVRATRTGGNETGILLEQPGYAEPASIGGSDLLHRAREFVLRRPDGPYRMREPGAEEEVRTVIRAAQLAAENVWVGGLRRLPLGKTRFGNEATDISQGRELTPERGHKHGAPARAHVLPTFPWPDAELLLALAWRESRWRSSARGARGEVGLAQLHPRYTHGPLRDPEANLRAAAGILANGLVACGSPGGALRLYATGGCGRPSRADRMVLRWSQELREEPR